MTPYHDKLIHAATAYDRRREGKRGHNIYALSHYFRAIEDAETLIAGGMAPRAALLECFNDRLLSAMLKAVGEPDFTMAEKR